MSPEQAAGSADVDTRADVYALGAMLYELLVGQRPLVRDEDPARPSARLATLGPATAEIAQKRSATPKQLSAQVRGDLDWIVMKALERERDRRYGSVTDLARDLSHYRSNEPVTARPPTLLYRTRKLARRHRTATALIAVLVPLGIVLGTALAIQTRRAMVERDRFERMAKFLINLVDNPSESVTGRWVTQTPEAILVEGLKKIETDLDDPLVQARTYLAIGRTLRSIDASNHAETATVRARERFEEPARPRAPRDACRADRAGARSSLAWTPRRGGPPARRDARGPAPCAGRSVR